MLRAILVSLGLALLLLWLVGVVDHATTWLSWVDGTLGLLTFALVFVTRETNTPLTASLGPTLIGLTLGLVFLVALATQASGWLTWFTFIFAGGYLTLAALAYFLHAYQPQMAADY
jgi:hypothetical protein